MTIPPGTRVRNRATGIVGTLTETDGVDCWIDSSHPCKVADLEPVQWPPVGAKVRNRATEVAGVVSGYSVGWVRIEGRPHWRPEDCEVIS